MAGIEHKPSLSPESKIHVWDEDAFSFEAVDTQDKGMVEGTLSASDSPADFLFANGQLLPHAFRPPPDSFRKSISKDSLTSSSSSSKGGGSSSSSTGSSRSSSTGGNSRLDADSKFPSDDADRSVPEPASADGPAKPVIKHVRFRSRDDFAPSPPMCQFMLSPAEFPNRDKANGEERQGRRRGKKSQHMYRSSRNPSKNCGIFRSFVSACRECHALEPSMQVERRAATTTTASRARSRTYV